MATSTLGYYPLFRAIDPSTNTPLSGGLLYTYEPGTTTDKATYTDSAKTTAQTNPIVLNSNGEPASPIYLDGEYKFVLKSSSGTTIWTVDNINKEQVVTTSVTGGNLISNPNFEVDDDSDGIPDLWTVVQTGTVTIDDTDSDAGGQSLKFTGTGSGAGTAETSGFIEINDSELLYVSFSLISSAATVKNIVTIDFYDLDKAKTGSTVTVYSESTASPTSWTRKEFHVAPVTSAKYFKLKLNGADVAGTAGNTKFDGITVIQGGTKNFIGASGSIMRTYGMDVFHNIQAYNRVNGGSSSVWGMDISGNVTISTWESVGPVGSGADNEVTYYYGGASGRALIGIWRAYLTKTTSDGPVGIRVWIDHGDKTGLSGVSDVQTSFYYTSGTVTTSDIMNVTGFAIIPISDSGMFNVQWDQDGCTQTTDLDFYVWGVI